MAKVSKAALIARIQENLRVADGNMDRIEEAASERLGIHRSDFRVLDFLSRGSGLTPTELARSAGLSAAAVTALLDRLERAGYARRRRDDNDRRRVIVEATPEAIGKVWPIFEELVKSSAAMLERFRLEDLETIAHFAELHSNVIAARANALAS